MGVHRRMWESTGAKVLTPQKLSPRLDAMDVMVLVGQTYQPPGKRARVWLERWLAAEKGRSLIYFGRDFNADIYYRQQTLAMLEPDKQERGAQLLAYQRATEISKRLDELPGDIFCEWFYLNLDQAPATHTEFEDDWAEDISGLAGSWPTGLRLQPPRRSMRREKPDWLVNPTSTTLKPATPFVPNAESSVERSQWSKSEYESDEDWDAAFENLPRYDVLLSDSEGQPLIFRLTHNRRFPGSQIIIVNNGAPFLNGSLVEPLHRRVGEKLIEACLPAERVGLLAFNELGLLISDAAETDPRGAGLEMLLEWPLSGVTLPALLLGIVVCAVLLPILGRPQRLPQRRLSDFGLHVEALGAMLYQSRDLKYAKETIAEYFVKVRGETPPDWLSQLDVEPSVPPRRASPNSPPPPASASATHVANPPPES
ncbi:MAG: hypothetical protein R3C53_15325 [Pirellulaceae bacterium]